MRGVRRVIAAVFTVFAGAAQAQLPAVGPPAAIAAAKAAMSDTAYGKLLVVRLLTVGQGDLVFERFGHNMLWIINTRTSESIAWNWGAFSFHQPAFMRRFLFGNNEYILQGQNVAQQLQGYSRDNREVVSQELALTPGQRAALDAFVRTNALPENMGYRYDYFLDNCSTRLRDALDIVLGGAIRSVLVPRSSDLTYRSEVLRLNQHSALLFMGMDLALGTPADRPLSPWEHSFIPMRLRDELQVIRVPGPDGATVPLAGPPKLLVDAEREGEPPYIDSRAERATIMIGALLLALVCLGLSVPARRGSKGASWGLMAVAVIVHVVIGALSALIVFMWAFTLHAFWAWNPHLLLFTPLSLVVAVVLPLARTRPRLRWWVERYHFTMAASAFLVGVAALLFRGMASGMMFSWASASWLFHLAFGLALYRAARAWPARPDPSAAGMRIAA